MNHASFIHAHGADADWRVALAECQRQLDTRMMASATEQHVSAQFTLGWCYLSDYSFPQSLTTTSFGRSRTGRFDICSCKPISGGRLPSLVQHRRLTPAFVTH